MFACVVSSPSADYEFFKRDALQYLRLAIREQPEHDVRSHVRRALLCLQFMNEECEDAEVTGWIARLRALYGRP